ncbi:threonylcarbamoyladenosine tRNA methylthiotransferase MtaB [bacterium MnTg02]|nr:threonylcarbamoyladenosine tRNA methylthiotransferase MtaB [bacterium MnTg02]
MSDNNIITFGCRLNSYESEVMRTHAEAAGLEDAIIINTCAVTAEAVRQARQAIRKARRTRPDAKIIVTGCAVQIDPEQFARMDEVDFVIGNDEKTTPGIFASLRDGDAPRVQVNDIMSVKETALHLIDGFGGRARAYVQIQNGCDHRCTFCTIPFGRGNSRSVPVDEIVTQLRRLVENGYREVVLTGVDITGYGRDLPGELTLGKLVRKILGAVPDLERLRLSSIDSIEADDVLFEVIANEDRLMPHLHLSLQSGDDIILKRMKRRHLTSDALAFCRRVQALRPDMVFGADLIAGFPTETEDMFDNTLRHIEDCRLTFLHVFPFSARPGTPAARMPQVPRDLVKRRAERLRSAGKLALGRYLDNQIGKTVPLLMENETGGRTPQFAEMAVTRTCQPGTIAQTQVVGHDGYRLHGRVLDSLQAIS